KLAMPFRATYAASKHAVQAFFDCLRAEVQEYGISVSTVQQRLVKQSRDCHLQPGGYSNSRPVFMHGPLGNVPN
uniref:Dehydrogenase/reductase SDR family member 7C n=1 Tax=Oncorhynchus kisutch TaxID=8019 RepID=A0A8C7CV70_ONCKI